MITCSRSRAVQSACLPVLVASLLTGCSSMNALSSTDDGSDSGRRSSLTGEAWFIEAIGGVDIIATTEPSVGFADDNQVFGNATCNRIVGTYERHGESLTIGPLGSTMMACPASEGDQELSLFTLLATVDRFQIDAAGALVLHGNDGNTIRALRR